jgi:glycosyltransferase involved in cell wall biosynthesis
MRFCLPALVSKLNHLQPAVIVSNMAAMNFNVLLAQRFLKKKPRIIIREAVTPSSIIHSQRLPGMVRTAYKNLYPRADRVLAPAQMIIDEFKNDLGMDISKFHVLYNPVDTKKLNAAWNVSTDISTQSLHFVAAGRLHAQKGFDRLITALPEFKPAHDWRLTIYGEGGERKTLQDQIKALGLENKVTLAGLVDEPWPMYAAADAFLLPSRWEGLPNVALESLALGTPVIAMREAGGIHEIARLAAPEHIRIAHDMKDFIKCMEAVTPNAARGTRASLLPKEFYLDAIIEKFERFLR